ncbi:unnamed protein product [Rhodiola kirilowii]
MQHKKPKWNLLLLLRRLLMCGVVAIGLLGLCSVHLISVHLPVLPSIEKKETGKTTLAIELNAAHELGQSNVSKLLVLSRKLDGASGLPDTKKLWKPPKNKDFEPCVDPSENYTTPEGSHGYLIVQTNGGLNQMRAGICDMVAVARIINATLVIPELDKRSFWQDSRYESFSYITFSDVFDEDYFINTLADDIKIVRKLPEELSNATIAVKEFRSWSGVEYYQDEIANIWKEYQVIRAAKSDSRLANNNLPVDIQKLRCRACYKALRFSPKIEAMGKVTPESLWENPSKWLYYMRKDMLAFSGCTYGLSPEEADELKMIRENTSHWKVKEIDAEEQRRKGYCPMTPKEVGMFLTALGYPRNTPIYIAAGEIYGGEARMVELRVRFPMLMNKEQLVTPEELEPFVYHASQMAALDYIVSVESDVFIPSYSGNMARAVEGHRRFLGHKKTISPDRKALVHLFDKIDRGSMKEGKSLSYQIIEIHKKKGDSLPSACFLRQGSPRKRKGPISGTKGSDRFRSEEPFT